MEESARIRREIEDKITVLANPETEGEKRRVFGAELEEELKNIGFDLRGHYPILQTMIYTIDVDFLHDTVTLWYGPEQEKMGTCKATASDVVETLKVWHNKITERKFDNQTFLKTLYSIYNTVKDRDQAAIPDIVSEYSRLHNIPKKTARMFISYDLFRLNERVIDGMELSLVTATRAYTRRHKDFLWVPTGPRMHGMYISHIKFKRLPNPF